MRNGRRRRPGLAHLLSFRRPCTSARGSDNDELMVTKPLSPQDRVRSVSNSRRCSRRRGSGPHRLAPVAWRGDRLLPHGFPPRPQARRPRSLRRGAAVHASRNQAQRPHPGRGPRTAPAGSLRGGAHRRDGRDVLRHPDGLGQVHRPARSRRPGGVGRRPQAGGHDAVPP